ncbi:MULTISPECIES: M20 family metallopeptidase [Pirellulaceae]|nr:MULTISPECIES: M20 family metallopeptidase [Pirellulaceae]
MESEQKYSRDTAMVAAVDPLEILRTLIAIPSVNPMGIDCSGPDYYEGKMTQWLQRFFQGLGVPVECHEVAPGRYNVIAKYESDSSAPTILLDSHQDTVPVSGMTIDPFHPTIRDGRIYGRGACDVKGGMAAMLSAFATLVRQKPSGSASVIMACTCDEEYTATGARHLARQWTTEPKRSELVSTPPDYCIVAEPTELNVMVAHRGVVRWKLRTIGRACHSSRPDEGRNAIYAMTSVVSALQRYANDLAQQVTPHPLCGPPTLSVGKISGGTSVNIVPDECEIEIDRRTIPGECSADVLAYIECFLREQTTADFEMLPPWIDADSLSDDDNQELANHLLAEVATVAGPREKQGAWYGTNASCFSVRGHIPSVVFGPGSIAQAHTVDEWLEITQLYQATEVYYRMFCNPLPRVTSHTSSICPQETASR